MADTKPPLVNLEELMRGCKKVILQHGKRPYFLTITRRGNLILTSADDDSLFSEKNCHESYSPTGSKRTLR